MTRSIIPDAAPADAPATAGPEEWCLPEHDAVPLSPPRGRRAVCLFVINEAERLHRQLAKMRAVPHGLDVIVADGGSSDGSTAPRRLADLGVTTLLVKRGPGRLSAQMRMGLAWCLRAGYDGGVVMDGNDKDDPEALPRFDAALSAGIDHVQGSRYLPGGRAINTPLARHLAVRLIHAPAVSLAAGRRYTDTTNGFRAYSRRLLLDPRVAPFRPVFNGYELHYYLAIRAARLGFRVAEIPVTRAYPAAGGVPTKIRGLRGNLLVLDTLARACLGRFDPPRRRAA
ncbi:MAG: glycosyltransferase family 2 protein [Planctomycetaceae bacterium]